MKTEIKITLSSVEASVLLDLLREKIDSLEKSSSMSELDNHVPYHVCLGLCLDLTFGAFNGCIE